MPEANDNAETEVLKEKAAFLVKALRNLTPRNDLTAKVQAEGAFPHIAIRWTQADGSPSGFNVSVTVFNLANEYDLAEQIITSRLLPDARRRVSFLEKAAAAFARAAQDEDSPTD